MADATTPDALVTRPDVDADGAPSKESDAHVHEAGTFSKGALRWGYFLLLNAIAGSVAIAFFIAVFYAEGLDPYLHGTYEWLLAHPGVTSFLAFSPLACSMLVGWGYSQRAKKRKAAAARALKAQEDAGPSDDVSSDHVGG
ncbi:MAG: hypothetical protein RIF41_27105 [Polyangiaceae bacterium]